jgi:hypothetical protein
VLKAPPRDTVRLTLTDALWEDEKFQKSKYQVVPGTNKDLLRNALKLTFQHNLPEHLGITYSVSGSNWHDTDVLSTWTDSLAESLEPLGIEEVSGVDAASVLPTGFLDSAYEALWALTDEDFATIAADANRFFETDRIGADDIRRAVERTRWHWPEQPRTTRPE